MVRAHWNGGLATKKKPVRSGKERIEDECVTADDGFKGGEGE